MQSRNSQFGAVLICASGLLSAQAHAAPDSGAAETSASGEIIITATRSPGSVLGNIPPLFEMDGAALQALGAATVSEIIAVLANQTQGANDGPPIILINGKRVADWRDVARFSPDAVARVQILPEEVASLYGYLPTQRVLNLILKADYRATTIEAQTGSSTHDWRPEKQVDIDYGHTLSRGWTTLGISYQNAGPMSEAARGVVQSTTQTDGRFRWLLPDEDSLSLNAGLNRTLDNGLGLAISARHKRDNSLSVRGQDAQGQFITTRQRAYSSVISTGLDGNIERWMWTAIMTLNENRNRQESRRSNMSAIGKTREQSASLNTTLSRTIFERGRINILASLDYEDLKSRSLGARATVPSDINRTDVSTRISLDMPLIQRNSANGYIGYSHISDFGALMDWGAGLSLQPVAGVKMQLSTSQSQTAPSLQQLQGPLLVSPGTRVYDPVTGKIVFVDYLSGGNQALEESRTQDYKLGLSYTPRAWPVLNVRADYRYARGENIVRYPARLSTAMLAAFPERFKRDAAGKLEYVDARALNLDASSQQSLRWGLNIMVPMGQARRTMQTYRGAGANAGASLERSGAGGADRAAYGLMRMMRGSDAQSGYWQIGLYHSWRFMDRVRLRSDQPWLDLLSGDSLSTSGGSARHSIDIEGGWSYAGLGFRVDGSYVGARQISDTPVLQDQLYFGDRLALNLRLFLTFDGRPAWVEKSPWLKGARLRLLLRNATDSAPDVRDGEGNMALAYQPALLEPRGRYVELSLRKQF